MYNACMICRNTLCKVIRQHFLVYSRIKSTTSKLAKKVLIIKDLFKYAQLKLVCLQGCNHNDWIYWIWSYTCVVSNMQVLTLDKTMVWYVINIQRTVIHMNRQWLQLWWLWSMLQFKTLWFDVYIHHSMAFSIQYKDVCQKISILCA